MVPSKALREKAMQLLAADAATLAQAANANKMKLVTSPFTPAESLVYADLTWANFDGSTPIDVELGAQPEATEPGTTDAVIDIKAPVGGFRWETTGVTNLPQTIVGFALVNDAEDTLFASGVFADPVTLDGVNQRVEVDDAQITQVANSMY